MANWTCLMALGEIGLSSRQLSLLRDRRSSVARSSRFSRDARNLGFYVKSLDFEIRGQHWGSQTKYTWKLQFAASSVDPSSGVSGGTRGSVAVTSRFCFVLAGCA